MLCRQRSLCSWVTHLEYKEDFMNDLYLTDTDDKEQKKSIFKNERGCRDIKKAQEQDWDGTIAT